MVTVTEREKLNASNVLMYAMTYSNPISIDRRTAKVIGAASLSAILMIATGVLILNSATTAQGAVLAGSGWEFPADEYGQGIEGINIYENSTGSWVLVGYWAAGNVDLVEDVPAHAAIKLRVFSRINCTLIGVSPNNPDSAKPYFRHSVIVYANPFDPWVIFSQENFTYYGWTQIGYTIKYAHEVVLNFLTEPLTSYQAAIGLEVFY